MDFDDALAYVRSRLRLGIKLGNDRFLALLERLGNPHSQLRVVHVAGTKGKGSTSTIAAGILQAAGYSTGLYLSPYVYDVTERIQIDGAGISRDDFARCVSTIRPHVEAIEETDLGPATEFEIKTAIGFCYFAERGVDYAVIEVGLGGRLDATNVIERPLVTAITSIGYDHVDLLGPTLADIAREKAGIVKRGIPCVTAVAEGSEAWASIETACRRHEAPLVRVASGRPAEVQFGSHVDGTVTISTPRRHLADLSLRLRGSFQHANASTAIGAIDAIAGRHAPSITDEQARRGIEDAYLPGRFEQISDRPVVYVDVAHNEMSAQALAASLREADRLPRPSGPASDTPRRLILVVGMSRAHEPASFLEPLLALGPAAVIATQPQFRPREAHETAAVAAGAKVDCVKVVSTGVVDACREALSMATTTDVICLTGSLYTVGEVPPDKWRDLIDERKF